MPIELVGGADVIKHPPHQLDVENTGHIGEPVGARRQEHRHHLLENGVLGTEHAHHPVEARPSGHDDLIHSWIVRRTPRRDYAGGGFGKDGVCG